jgi:hypothetical protein
MSPKQFCRRAVLLMLIGSLMANASSKTIDLVEAEAAFVLNILRFTEWPDSAFRSSTDPIRILAIDDETLFKNLQTFAAGKTINGRRIAVASAGLEDWSAPHVLVARQTDARTSRRIIDNVQGAATLTIGTTKEFLNAGGVIRVFTEGDMMRFEVNLDPARQSGLRLSAKALTLAKHVVGNDGP